jgi:glutamine amidotransferase
MKTGILNLEINNIKSIFNASKIISESYLINHIDDFQNDTDVLILPGNGKFSQGMKSILNKKFDLLIKNHLANNKKLIGICLGMQLMMGSSEESKGVEGLNLIEGSVKIIPENQFKIPLLGWYDVIFNENFFEKNIFFFNNKYSVNTTSKDIILGTIMDNLTVFIKKKNIYGLQFHPEKSSKQGLKILKKIINIQ